MLLPKLANRSSNDLKTEEYCQNKYKLKKQKRVYACVEYHQRSDEVLDEENAVVDDMLNRNETDNGVKNTGNRIRVRTICDSRHYNVA